MPRYETQVSFSFVPCSAAERNGHIYMNDYEALCIMAKSLVDGESDAVTVMSNFSALIFEHIDRLNWAGFYRSRGNKLILGPFQGKVACTAIDYGNGVCGYAARENCTALIDNVHEFSSHIACDSASNSEIVIPIHDRFLRVIGVLDIDSPEFSRFNENDKTGLEKLVEIFEEFLIKNNISYI